MKIEVSWILGFLDHLLGGQAETLCRTRIENAHDGIVKGMTEKGVTPDTASVKVCIRDALFRCWKAVVHSGTLADLVRDATDKRVLARVEALFPHGAGSLNAIVEETRKGALAVVFGEEKE
jgi:hypothetical protein